MTIRSILISSGNIANDTNQSGGGNNSNIDSTPWALAIIEPVDFYLEIYCSRVDSDGNIYISGFSDGYGEYGQGYFGYFLAKLTTVGAISWVSFVPDSTIIDPNYYYYVEPYSIATNSSGTRVYVTGYGEDNDNWYVQLMCYNSSTGALVWQKGLGWEYIWNDITYYDGGYGHDVRCDVPGNIYVCGNISFNNNDYTVVAKFTPTGDLIWKKGFYDTSSWGYGCVLDSASNIIVSMESSIAADSNRTWTTVAKITTSGTLLWKNDFKHPYAINQYGTTSVTVDTQNYIYMSAAPQYVPPGASGHGLSIHKIRPDTGETDWIKIIGSLVSGSLGGSNIVYSSKTGLIYVAFEDQGTYTGLATFTTQGALTSLRRINGIDAPYWGVQFFSVDPSGNTYISTSNRIGWPNTEGTSWSGVIIKNLQKGVKSFYNLNQKKKIKKRKNFIYPPFF